MEIEDAPSAGTYYKIVRCVKGAVGGGVVRAFDRADGEGSRHPLGVERQ